MFLVLCRTKGRSSKNRERKVLRTEKEREESSKNRKGERGKF